MSTAIIPTVLNPAQLVVDRDPHRFITLKAGRRFGKTVVSAVKQTKWAWKIVADHWHLSPTLRPAREDAWNIFLQTVPASIIRRVRRGTLCIELVNGSKIYMKSSDEMHNLRAGKLGSVVFEEADFHHPDVWPNIIRPKLADLQGPALFISSPRGRWFTQLYNSVVDGRMGIDWSAHHYTIYDNPKMKPEEIESIRLSTSERTWRREYMAEEFDDEGQVYSEFQEGSIFRSGERYEDASHMRCVLGLDWGFDDDTAGAFLHIAPDGTIILNDEHSRAGLDVEAQAAEIRVKSAGLKIAATVLDVSAFAEKGEAQTIAKRFGKFGITALKATREKDASVDLIKRLMRGDGKRAWLQVNSRCRTFLEAVRAWEYGQHEPDILAAVRYGVWHIIKTGMSSILGSTHRFSLEEYKPFVSRLPMRGPKRDIRFNFDVGAFD